MHYLYYTKLTLAAILGLVALFLAYRLHRKRDVPYSYLIVLPIVAQIVSFLGWAVREIGRKPWTIYGVMDVSTAHTINPPNDGRGDNHSTLSGWTAGSFVLHIQIPVGGDGMEGMTAMILYFLALVFGLHITMVNLGIAFSTIPPMKRKGEKEKDELY